MTDLKSLARRITHPEETSLSLEWEKMKSLSLPSGMRVKISKEIKAIMIGDDKHHFTILEDDIKLSGIASCVEKGIKEMNLHYPGYFGNQLPRPEFSLEELTECSLDTTYGDRHE